MTRRFSALLAGLFFACAGLTLAQEPPPTKEPPPAKKEMPPPAKEPPEKDPPAPVPPPTVHIYGSNNNINIAGGVPTTRVINNERDWNDLARLWDIPNPPKVDFTREFLVVATSRAENLVVQTRLDDQGDLRVQRLEGGMTMAGFRWGIKSFKREGVKMVDGRPLVEKK